MRQSTDSLKATIMRVHMYNKVLSINIPSTRILSRSGWGALPASGWLGSSIAAAGGGAACAAGHGAEAAAGAAPPCGRAAAPGGMYTYIKNEPCEQSL